jgi:methylmalonyl-CoA mutase cobalamin-binding subunit
METRFEEPRHPIGVAAERTGLSPDVIRAWERRYGAVVPARDESGQRRYSDAEVERLRLLRRATDAGRSISDVAGLERDSLAELVRGDEAGRRAAGRSAPEGSPVPDLEALALSLDGEGLEAGLRRALLARGFVGFAEQVAAPLLRRLGDGWHAGEVTVAQEHLATATVRRVLETTRDMGGGAENGSRPVAVVATLDGERHEVGALMVATTATLAGWRVAYLGADLPIPEVVSAAESTGASAVLISGTYGVAGEELVSGLRRLRSALPAAVEVYAGGAAARRSRGDLEPVGVHCPQDLEALRAALEDGGVEAEG